MLLGFYYVMYLVIACMWTIYVHGLLDDDPRYKGLNLERTLAINFVIWPICVLAVIYAKVVLKRDTLFVVDKKDKE